MKNIDKKLQRFIDAQDEMTYKRALEELLSGKKKTHWMWFIFPQITGLGQSELAKYFGIESLQEAEEYWNHPLLGARLRECISIVNNLNVPAEKIFGEVDAQKFCSCITLFLQIDSDIDKSQLGEALHQFYGGQLDQKTLTLLRKGS